MNPLKVHCDDSLQKRIEDYAQEHGISKSSAAKILLSKGLKNER